MRRLGRSRSITARRSALKSTCYLELPGGEIWAIEIKRSLSPKVERGFHVACDDLKPARRFVVYAGGERVPLPHGIVAMGVAELAAMLVALGAA